MSNFVDSSYLEKIFNKFSISKSIKELIEKAKQFYEQYKKQHNIND